jgi:tight adherence protein B
MAEVLSNLSTIIRKRKQLRLKIRALTSEGRITTWMFSAIPFIQMGAIYFIKPDYLDPLFDTNSGIICLIFSICLIAIAIYIARQLCKMDI